MHPKKYRKRDGKHVLVPIVGFLVEKPGKLEGVM